MKRLAFFLLLAAACLLAGYSSYRFGWDRAQGEATANGSPASKAMPTTEIAPEAIASRSPAELASLKEKLKHSYETNPSAKHDWILRGQTSAVLATMTIAELKELLDELLALHADGRWPLTSWDVILAADLLREWGRRDPVAACTKEVPDLASAVMAGRMAAFHDWLLRDPAAVARWMSTSDQVPADLRKEWLSERVKADPGDAVRQLAHLPSATREMSLLEWSTSFALMPAERGALLDAVKDDPEMLKQCAGRMAAALADRSVEEAYAFVDSLQLDEEMTAWLDDDVFAKWATREPQVAFAEWARQKETRVSESFLFALDSWSMNSPGTEEAIKWVGSLETGPAKEKIQLRLIESLTENERFEEAVRLSMSMSDREEGKRQLNRAVRIWGEKAPAQAKEGMKAIFELPAGGKR